MPSLKTHILTEIKPNFTSVWPKRPKRIYSLVTKQSDIVPRIENVCSRKRWYCTRVVVGTYRCRGPGRAQDRDPLYKARVPRGSY
jgi:hypothetical protein